MLPRIEFQRLLPTTVDEIEFHHDDRHDAKEYGVYDAIWHPKESGINTASDLVVYIEKAMQDFEERAFTVTPPRTNRHWRQGYQKYESLHTFLRNVVRRAKNWPDASIEVKW